MIEMLLLLPILLVFLLSALSCSCNSGNRRLLKRDWERSLQLDLDQFEYWAEMHRRYKHEGQGM